MNERLDDVVIGVEMSLITQEQVVSEFRELVERDIVAATDRYAEFADKLERVSSHENAQIRSMIGGPDSMARAGLIDIMAVNYSAASNDIKEKIREEAIKPLMRDNTLIVQLAVAQMKNPYLVGDIIRDESLFFPGADFYEEHLLGTNALQDRDQLQAWLDKLGGSLFAATTIALQRDSEEVVTDIVIDNELLFQDAAHVMAAYLDSYAEIIIMRGSTVTKSELTDKYRSSFVDIFAKMVRNKAEQTNWLPLSNKISERYSKND